MQLRTSAVGDLDLNRIVNSSLCHGCLCRCWARSLCLCVMSSILCCSKVTSSKLLVITATKRPHLLLPARRQFTFLSATPQRLQIRHLNTSAPRLAVIIPGGSREANAADPVTSAVVPPSKTDKEAVPNLAATPSPTGVEAGGTYTGSEPLRAEPLPPPPLPPPRPRGRIRKWIVRFARFTLITILGSGTYVVWRECIWSFHSKPSNGH